MSRALRFSPLVVLLVVVAALVWRLATPADTTVRSKLDGQQVPAFVLPAALPSKAGLSTADLASGKPRLVNIFASWCVPCIGEAPVLEDLRRRGVKIEGIAIRDTPEAVAAFLARHGDPYERIGSDRNSSVQMALGSAGVPETFVVDGRGVIRYQYVGPLTRGNVQTILSELKRAR